MCFGGAKSDTILEDIKTDQRFKTTDNVPIGQYLYDKLNETFSNQANFETVIASIELIITYHLAKTNDTENPNLKSIVPSFLIFNEDFLNKIDNFTLREIPEHPDEVILEYFNNLVLQTFTLPRKTVRLFYYSKILNNFLSLISISSDSTLFCSEISMCVPYIRRGLPLSSRVLTTPRSCTHTHPPAL